MDQFDEWLDSGLTLPISGREFRVEPPSALKVLCLHRSLADTTAWNDAAERRHVEDMLGATWAEMIAEGVPELKAIHAGRFVITYYADSADNALAAWRFTTPEPKVEPTPPRREPHIDGVDPPDSYDPPGTINEFDPGGGPYRPQYGDRVWANPLHMAPAYRSAPKVDEPTISWLDILGAWDAICIDFQHWGIDLSSGVLEQRPWHWLAVRLASILGNPQSWARRTIDARKAAPGGDSPR